MLFMRRDDYGGYLCSARPRYAGVALRGRTQMTDTATESEGGPRWERIVGMTPAACRRILSEDLLSLTPERLIDFVNIITEQHATIEQWSLPIAAELIRAELDRRYGSLRRRRLTT